MGFNFKEEYWWALSTHVGRELEAGEGNSGVAWN